MITAHCILIITVIILVTVVVPTSHKFSCLIFLSKFNDNRNLHDVVRQREWEWELLHKNGREWESKFINYSCTVVVLCDQLAEPPAVQ